MRADPKEIVRRLQEGKGVREVARELGVSPATVCNWKRRAVSPHTLRLSRHQARRRSTAPKSSPRKRALTPAQREEVRGVRTETGWGSERIQRYLGLEADESTVHRFLVREGLVRSGPHRRPRYQDTAHKGLHNVAEPGTLQMDVKYATPQISGLPHTTYLYAAIDLFTRYRAAWIYPSLDSGTAAEALEWILYCMPFPVAFVQTDNGLEFQSEFQRALRLFDLPHHFIHKSSPNENAVVERAFRTDEDEFFSLRLPRAGRPRDLPELNARYQEWLGSTTGRGRTTGLTSARRSRLSPPGSVQYVRAGISLTQHGMEPFRLV